MPLKLSVGLSRKQGLPNFGSVGATCLVELELPFDALREEAVLRVEAEKTLGACRAIVEAELARHLQPVTSPPKVSSSEDSLSPNVAASPEHHPPAIVTDAPTYRERPTDRPATPRQVQAIERLTLKLGAHAGDWLFERIGETPPHCLSLAEASALIDELQTQFPPPSRLAG